MHERKERTFQHLLNLFNLTLSWLWFSEDVCSSEFFDTSLGFDIHRNDRASDPHGGVLLAVKKDLELNNVKKSKSLELISGTIKTSQNKKMIIGSYYRPPNRTDDDYLIKTKEEISSTLRKTNKNAVFILGGDFNAPDINWQSNNITGAKHYSKKVNQTYLDLAAEHSLEQMVDFPTRGDNTLNLVFTSHPSYVERCKPLPPIADNSDHDIVLFDTSHQPVITRPKRRTIYLWKKHHGN